MVKPVVVSCSWPYSCMVKLISNMLGVVPPYALASGRITASGELIKRNRARVGLNLESHTSN